VASDASPRGGGARAAARRRAALARAAAQRRTRRRRTAIWTATGLVLTAATAALVVGAGVLAAPGGSAAGAARERLGPEGMALESGAALAANTTPRSGAPVDGIGCAATEQVAYHIHTHLAVYVNGSLRPVPAGVGVVAPVPQATPRGTFDAASRCYYWLHVHARDGVLHVEAPTAAPVTLGQFFAVWGQPLTTTRVAAAAGRVTVLVDGRRVAGAPGRIVLRPHEAIQLDVGAPTPFHQVDWSGSNL
jgi:hypothetical protein